MILQTAAIAADTLTALAADTVYVSQGIGTEVTVALIVGGLGFLGTTVGAIAHFRSKSQKRKDDAEAKATTASTELERDRFEAEQSEAQRIYEDNRERRFWAAIRIISDVTTTLQGVLARNPEINGETRAALTRATKNTDALLKEEPKE